MIGVHVDDLIILARNITEMKSVKASLKLQFKMKDMGELHYYVGVCIIQDVQNKQVFLHQGHFEGCWQTWENLQRDQLKYMKTTKGLFRWLRIPWTGDMMYAVSCRVCVFVITISDWCFSCSY